MPCLQGDLAGLSEDALVARHAKAVYQILGQPEGHHLWHLQDEALHRGSQYLSKKGSCFMLRADLTCLCRTVLFSLSAKRPIMSSTSSTGNIDGNCLFGFQHHICSVTGTRACLRQAFILD